MLAVLLSAWGCAGTNSSVPRYGRITFHDPAPRRGMHKKRLRPITITYDSAPPTEQVLTEEEVDGNVLSFSGRSSDPNSDIERAEFHRQMAARNLVRNIPSFLPPETFAALWSRLDEVGVLDLPKHVGNDPPKDQPYFLFDDTRTRQVFLRPRDMNLESLSEEESRQVKAWREGKRVIVTGS